MLLSHYIKVSATHSQLVSKFGMDAEQEAITEFAQQLYMSERIANGVPRSTLLMEYDGLSAASKRIYEIAAKAVLMQTR